MVVLYAAGALATAAISWVYGLRAPWYQRLPLSCHLLLGLGWPLYLAFLGCSAAVQRR